MKTFPQSRRALSVSLILILSGCAGTGVRSPSSIALHPPHLQGADWIEASQRIAEDVALDTFNKSTCSVYLKELQAELDHIDLTALTGKELPEPGLSIRQRLGKYAPKIVEQLWATRLTLHDRLPEIGSECATEVRQAFRQIRFVEDYLSELAINVEGVDPTKIEKFFEGEPVPMRERPAFYLDQRRVSAVPTEPRAGDVFVTRGVSFLSAMIARLGSNPSQFSHIVYLAETDGPKLGEPKDQKVRERLSTIESYVGKGVDFYDFNFALKNENARILWLRPRDEVLAAKTAKETSELVRSRIDSGNKIKYDYRLDFTDRKTLSCAEVAQYGFERSSNGKLLIPEFPSELNPSNQLVQLIGAPGGKTFSPGDLENDSRFMLMGDFHDLRITRDSRQKDAVLTKIVEWMDRDGYKLQKTLKSRAATPIWVLRKTPLWPLVNLALKLDLSKEVPPRMMRTLILVSKVGEIMLEAAQAADKEFESKAGVPMTYKQLYDSLEKFRSADAQVYLSNKKEAKLHPYFRPDHGVKVSSWEETNGKVGEVHKATEE